MTESRFRVLQGVLFAAAATAAVFTETDAAFEFETPTAAPLDEEAKGIPTVPRHRVLRRHLQGQPAFVVGALGNVGMEVPEDSAHFDAYADAAAKAALGLLRPTEGERDGLFFQANYASSSSATGGLTWTGDLRRSDDGGAHVRLQQTYGDRVVQGGNIMVHTDAAGNMMAVNGEYVDCVEQMKLLNQQNELLPPSTAISQGLKFAGIDQSVVSQTQPELDLVVGEDLSCCLAYQSTVVYWDMDDVTNSKLEKRDILYADATRGRLCAREPLVLGHAFRGSMTTRRSVQLSPLSRIQKSLSQGNTTGSNASEQSVEDDGGTAPLAQIATYLCAPLTGYPERDPPARGECRLISNSSTPISTGDLALDSAHNYALATFDYYWYFHGLNSLDGNGYELISYVLNDEFDLANAYWNGFHMTYGDGNDRFWPLSRAADVVAHELTHGVTQFSSRLIYRNESGAINEAWSDIFGALIERQVGARGEDIWTIGENITKREGDVIRNMANPSLQGHFDYYPNRYQGEQDNGGVHWNSGIANLAFKLLLTGGRHPKEASEVEVTGLIEIFNDDEELAFALAGRVFYCANSECLTRHSTFEDARHCTATICGTTGIPQDPLVVNSIHTAWYAVGVGEDPSLGALGPTTAPTPSLGEETLTVAPTSPPSDSPSRRITQSPSQMLTEHPTAEPTGGPSLTPTNEPFSIPTTSPTRQPSNTPTIAPSHLPTSTPTRTPTRVPTQRPTSRPTLSPTRIPTRQPTLLPTLLPTKKPTGAPSAHPTDVPTKLPSPLPSVPPTRTPSSSPLGPTVNPTSRATTNQPSGAATGESTPSPSHRSSAPTARPTSVPSTVAPSRTPTRAPTNKPTTKPSVLPSTDSPTEESTAPPSNVATPVPSQIPPGIFDAPTTAAPSPGFGEEELDKTSPTSAPSSPLPMGEPSTTSPSAAPTASRKTGAPTTASPSVQPSKTDITLTPSLGPTLSRDRTDIFAPNDPISPTKSPSDTPTEVPTRGTASTLESRDYDFESETGIPWTWIGVWSGAAVLALGLIAALRNRMVRKPEVPQT